MLPAVIIGLYLNYKLVKTADDEIFYDGIIIGGLLIIFLVGLMWTNVQDRKEYRRSTSKFSFLPTTTGILFIISFICTDYILKARDNSPLFIQAGSEGSRGAWYEFREDGTYKFANSGGLGATYYRGTYTLNDSIIVIDKSNDNVVPTHKFVIRKFNSFGTERTEKFYELNERNETINVKGTFTVNLDNRKK